MESFDCPKNYRMLEKIASGTFGQVVLATKQETGDTSSPVAIKIIKSAKQFTAKALKEIQNEKNVLEKCAESPFIVKIKEFVQEQKTAYFVLEYLSGGELNDIIKKRGHLSEDAVTNPCSQNQKARFYASQVVLALEDMHSKDIVYRDLKPENVLLDQNGYIKLTDFGLSELNVVENTLKKVCGTPEYVSPEMLFESGYGKPIDFWSLGVFIFEMITGRTPFESRDQETIFEKIKQEQVIYPASITPQLKSLLDGLFQKNPSKRLGSKGIDCIKKHPWFMRTNWEALKRKLMKAPYKELVKLQMRESTEDLSTEGSPLFPKSFNSAFDSYPSSSNSV